MTRRIIGLLLAVVMCASLLSVGVFASGAGKAVGGEVPRAAFSLADGADVVCYSLGASSRYGAAEFSVLTFDVTQGGLLLETVRPGESVTGRRVVAAIRPDGSDGASRFALTGGAISASLANGAPAFGVSAAGEAMIGELASFVELRDRDAGETIVADAVNANSAICVWTADRADEIPNGKFRVAIDCPADGLLVPGVPVEGVVTAAALPGESLAADGAITVASDAALNAFVPGDRVTLTADVSDARNNTASWRTVETSVAGDAILVRDGEAVAAPNESAAPSVIGVRPDGSAAILSFARGAKNEMNAADLASLCVELGMSDAIAIGGEDTVALTVPDGEDGGEAPELPDVAAQIASPLWYVKHMKPQPVEKAPEAIPTVTSHDAAQPGVAEAGSDGETQTERDGYEPTNALFKQIEFDSTGEWLTLVINESDVEAWYGKIY